LTLSLCILSQIPDDGVGWYEVKFDDGDYRDDVALDELKLFSFVPEESVAYESETDEPMPAESSQPHKESSQPSVPEISFERKYSAPPMMKDMSPRKMPSPRASSPRKVVIDSHLMPPGMRHEQVSPGPMSSPSFGQSPTSNDSGGGGQPVGFSSTVSGGIGGGQSPSHGNNGDFTTDYNVVDPWFLPLVDSPSHASIANVAKGLVHTTKKTKSLSLSFMPETTTTASNNTGGGGGGSSIPPPEVKLAAMQIRCEALEALRCERELRGSAWEEHGGMGHAPGGDDAGWKLVDAAVLSTSLKPGGMKSFLDAEEKAMKESEGFGIMGEVDGIDEEKGKVISSLIGPQGAAHGGALWEALLQARVRTLGLVRLHHGPGPTLPLIQATTKLAKTYSHQSLWPQVINILSLSLSLCVYICIVYLHTL
jgi:hypothetical protein